MARQDLSKKPAGLEVTGNDIRAVINIKRPVRLETEAQGCSVPGSKSQ